MDELLTKFKISIGDFNDDDTMNIYYLNKLNFAKAHLEADDISEDRINSELGQDAIILCAMILMNGDDIATNDTLNLIRQTLSIQTRGDEAEDV